MMIDDHYLELMSGEIDGVNSAAGSRELKEYLAAHPAARSVYEELCRLGHVFSTAGELEPPPYLRDRILAAVTASGAAAGPAGSPADRHEHWFRFSPRFGYGLAAGLVIGLALFGAREWISSRQSLPQQDFLLGVMNHPAEPDRAVATEESGIALGELGTGSARVLIYEDSYLLSLSLTTQVEIEVVLRYTDPVRLVGFTRTDHHSRRLSVSEDGQQYRADLIHIGTCDYRFLFGDGHRSHNPLQVMILKDGAVVFERWFSSRRK
jgi:hypothetical protein